MRTRQCQTNVAQRAGALLALLLTLAGAPAAAEPTVTVNPGLGGYFRRDRPLPVEVILDNPGGAARARVTVETSTEEFPQPPYEVPERTLPASTRWRGFLYPPAAQAGGAGQAALWVGGRRTQRLTLSGQAVTPADRLLVVVGPEAGALKGVGTTLTAADGSGNRVPAYLHVSPVGTESLPDRPEGYAAADLVVLAGVSSDELSPAQQGALSDWVIGGGRLALGGGTHWQLLRAPFYERLLPVTLSGSRVAGTAVALRQIAAEPGPSGTSFLCAVGTPKPGQVTRVVAEGGLPLVVRGRHGLGEVIFLAFDPTAPPFRGWEAASDFWKNLAEHPGQRPFLDAVLNGDTPMWVAYSGNPGIPDYHARVALARALNTVTQADLPGLGLVAGFLVAYIVALVPVNYLVLRRLGRREWAWLTSPAIILFFTGAAYALGAGMHGGKVALTRAGVVETVPGETRARAVEYAGLFAPGRGGYEVTAGGAWLLRPLEWEKTSAGVVEGPDPVRIHDLRLDTWEQAPLRATGTVDLGGGIVLTRRPTERSAARELLVENRTPFDLEECRVAISTGALLQPLGRLPSGGSLRVTLPRRAGRVAGEGLLPQGLAERPKGRKTRSAAVREALLRAAIAAAFARPENLRYGTGGNFNQWRAPVMIGWARQPMADIRVDGRAAPGPTATMFVVHLAE